ncbi:RNA polymerase sigma factor [Ferdinandcohnia quinoae]|uniref:RNA polymerase sigma factor n=1 Tax=Fredinandcohnia quinoae TaxID=2918902 RepID=A0AAW5DW68_9BACI|nr:RNA polymerase sigma factor [Fredinandcohnia sp. SECRCQ15]MCH1624593.1 RNA polymerase sigma factor [Fredinandcohnia sp. SECRCQ15]
MSDFKKQVLTDWYEQYSDSLFKYICMMTRDYQEAQDLTQETFIKAYNKYEFFEGRANVKTWLFSIAHNVTVDFLRKRKPLRMIEVLFQAMKDHSPLPEDIIEMNDSIRELYKALGNMKASYREVIILRKIKEFSIQETSQILNWPESKVKITLHRALPVLEQQLKKEGFVYDKTQ